MLVPAYDIKVHTAELPSQEGRPRSQAMSTRAYTCRISQSRTN